MTEEEKAIGGYLFNPTHPELVKKKLHVHNLCIDYGMLHEDDPQRTVLLKKSQFGFVFPVAPKPCAVKDQSGIGTYKRIGT